MQSWQTGIKTLSHLLGLKPSWFGILKRTGHLPGRQDDACCLALPCHSPHCTSRTLLCVCFLEGLSESWASRDGTSLGTLRAPWCYAEGHRGSVAYSVCTQLHQLTPVGMSAQLSGPLLSARCCKYQMLTGLCCFSPGCAFFLVALPYFFLCELTARGYSMLKESLQIRMCLGFYSSSLQRPALLYVDFN